MKQLEVLWLLTIIIIYLHFCSSKESKQCIYLNDKIHTIFNFQILSNEENIRHENTEENLKLQLCQPLKNPCNGDKKAQACLFRDNKEIVLGFKPDFNDDDGRMRFNFTGKLCKKNIPYTLTIEMLCDFKSNSLNPKIDSYSENQCAIHMSWRTIAACVPDLSGTNKTINCTVTDDNDNFYDLSSLTKYSDNYIVPINTNFSIILNICHSIIYGAGAVCPYNSGVCLKGSRTTRYETIGDLASPTIENNSLIINYKSGKQCAEEGFTKISFICDYEAHNTSPSFFNVTNDCNYYLIWKTSSACPKKTQSNLKSSCSAIDPVTKFEYNLKPLMDKDYIIKSPKGIQYKIRVCTPLLSHSCELSGSSADAGVCSALNKIVGGKANSNFFWVNDGSIGPFLNYTNGSLCENDKRRFTLIQFNCVHDKSQNVPVIVKDKACHLYVQWNTSLVCQEKSTKYLSINDKKKSEPQTQEITLEKKQIYNELLYTTTVLPDTSTTPVNSIDESSKTIFVTVVIISILLGVCGSFIVIYLVKSQVKRRFNLGCCSRCFGKSDIRMQYSKINTGPEMDSLLDTPDTLCQSEDSDDDLLRI